MAGVASNPQQPPLEEEAEMMVADQQQEGAEMTEAEEEPTMEPINSSLLIHFDTVSTCGMRFEKYQSVWIDANLIPAVKVIQQKFQPRPDDIFFCFPPKDGNDMG